MNAVPKCKCCNHLYSAQTFDDVLLYLILRTIFIIHRVRALFYKLSFNHYIHYFAISIHFNHSLEIASVQFFCASASKCSQKLERFKTVRLKRMFDNVFFFLVLVCGYICQIVCFGFAPERHSTLKSNK